jgi:hypothetical protein
MATRHLIGAACLKKISVILLEEMPRIAHASDTRDTRPTETMLREVIAAVDGLERPEDDAARWTLLEKSAPTVHRLGASALRIVSPVNAVSLRESLKLMDDLFGVDD